MISEAPESPGGYVENNSGRQAEKTLNLGESPMPDSIASFNCELPRFDSLTQANLSTPQKHNDSPQAMDNIPESKSGTSGNSKDHPDTKSEIMDAKSKFRSNISHTKKTKSREFSNNRKLSNCSSSKEPPSPNRQPDQIRDKYPLSPKKKKIFDSQ